MKLYLCKSSALALCITSSSWVAAQQPATPQSVLASVLRSLGAANIQGSSLSGTAELITGSSDDTGPFAASCSVNGTSQLLLELSAGSFIENRQSPQGSPSGTWVDSQGQSHQMAGHNVLTTESWFCPQIAIARFLLDTSLGVQFIGQESKQGVSVAHFTVFTPALDNSTPSAILPHLTKTEIYLDFQTLRPVALDFNIHPDDNANIDIPVEIRFSNYKNSGGVWIPFTVQKYINSTLTLGLQVTSASNGSTTSISQ